MSDRKKLIVAFDQNSREEFIDNTEHFKRLPVVLKVGLRLLPKLQKEDLLDLKNSGFEIFVDAKLHDIPTQVAEAVQTWAELGADYITVHLSGGRQMLLAAQKAATEHNVTLFGVSVLTSLQDSDLVEMACRNDVATQVRHLVQLGLDCGLKSFVCSAQEIPQIREISKEAILVCPGIHLDGTEASSDQKRSVALSKALELGVDMPVLGRAIFKNENPRQLSRNILDQLK